MWPTSYKEYCKNLKFHADYIKEYNEEEKQIIIELYSKVGVKKPSIPEWFDFYERCKSNKHLQIALVMHPDIPDEIAFKVVVNKSFKDVYAAIVGDINGKGFEPYVYQQCFEHLTDNNLEKIYSETSNDKYINSRYVQPFNAKAFDFITQKIVKKLDMGKKNFLPHETKVLLFSKDVASISRILMEKRLPERVRTNIADNQNLSDFIREKAFFEGDINYDLLHYATPKMAEAIYRNNIDSITESTKSSEKSASASTSLICRLLTNNQFSHSIERDILDRCCNIKKNKNILSILSSLAINTTSTDILKDLYEKLKTRTDIITAVTQNKNCPDDIKKDAFDMHFFKIFSNSSSKLKSTAILEELFENNNTDKKYIEQLSERLMIPVRSKNWTALTYFGDLYYLMCYNKYTPNIILEEFEEKIQDKNMKLFAKAFLEGKKAGLTENEMILLYNTLKYKEVPFLENVLHIDYYKVIDVLECCYDSTRYGLESYECIVDAQAAIERYVNNDLFVDAKEEVLRQVKLNEKLYKYEMYLEENKVQQQIDKIKELQEKQEEEIEMWNIGLNEEEVL